MKEEKKRRQHEGLYLKFCALEKILALVRLSCYDLGTHMNINNREFSGVLGFASPVSMGLMCSESSLKFGTQPPRNSTVTIM